MRRLLFILLFITSIVNAQTFTQIGKVYGINNAGVNGIRVILYKRTNTVVSSTTVKVYSTHNGNGNTGQYAAYPASVTEMDKCFNTAYSNTVLRWSGNITASTSLNWTYWQLISNAGATVPNNGEYFSTEVTGTFIPAVSGTYSFGINSDDGADLLINGTLVTSYYGGHGMSGYQYGSISLTAGTQYTFKARMQEYGGGEGLAVVWKRPGQTSYSLQTSELGVVTTSAWTLDTSYITNSTGDYSISRTSPAGTEWRITLDTLSIPSPQLADASDNSNLILTKRSIIGPDYYRYDLNLNNNLTVSDIYLQIQRRNGKTWTAPRYRILTSTEYNTIRASTSNLRATYPGVQTQTTGTLTSGGITNFYMIRTGYSN
jgi:hypothetical protein